MKSQLKTVSSVNNHSESTITFRISNEDKAKLKAMLNSINMPNATWLHSVIESDYDIYQKNAQFLGYIGAMIESYENLLAVARAYHMMSPIRLKKCYDDLSQMKLLFKSFTK